MDKPHFESQNPDQPEDEAGFELFAVVVDRRSREPVAAVAFPVARRLASERELRATLARAIGDVEDLTG